MCRYGCALILLLLYCPPALAKDPAPMQTAQSGIVLDSFTLRNGMQVIVVENHRVPAVTHMLWYGVGSADDLQGRSGLAHYNEHMMFQGTKRQKAGEFAKRVASAGGVTNAFTSYDYTAYYVSIAKEHLSMVMEMEADRMLNLAPNDAQFAKERQVILEERRMTVDNAPGSLLTEAMRAALFRHHPYRLPIIGWMHEMEALGKQDVLEFHQLFYHPSNAVLIVAGDITPGEVRALAEKYYASLPAGKAPSRQWQQEPPQREARQLTLRHPNVKQVQWLRYYATPSYAQAPEKVLPAYILAQILGGSQTGRLYQLLVEQEKLATAAGTAFDGFNRGPGVFMLHVTPKDAASIPVIEKHIDAMLQKICMPDSALTKDEFKRAKTLFKADAIYSRDGLENVARQLGVLVMLGLPPEYLNRWPDYVEQATEQQVCETAKAWLQPQASVTGYLLPELAQ